MAKETSKEVSSFWAAGLGLAYESSMAGSENGTAKSNEKIHPLWLISKDVTKIIVWIFCFLWHVLIITLFLDIKISSSVLVLIPCIVLAAMIILVAVFVGLDALEAKKAENPSGSKIFQKYVSFKLAILSGWGILFRALFISLVGIAGYHWIDPQPVGHTPFPDLTLRQFFSNLCAWLLVGGCIVWFFKFPKNKNPMSKDPSENPYFVWGGFGAFLIALVMIVAVFGGGVLMLVQEAMK